ncbi:universal stress protein [Pedobacter paludis]|uniref:UspA domain-containing protein n=1 Tax=Pedobacter paludis TaxID=2203212 RepID=A0A317EWV6_9SPHI|nr:universal stress protein [Pedobacter paludis]PWS30443.1 hypothetical protein DF947_18655 [Pedobacter paludis]
MKKILVPVNFSPATENAAYYASAMACKIGGSVELVHVLPLAVQSSLASSLRFPEYEFERLSTVSQTKLSELSINLEHKIRDSCNVQDFKPRIYGNSLLGNVIDEVGKHFDAGKMDLVVMGITKAPSINRIIGGSTVRSAIKNCELPLLLIPESSKFRSFKKVAFASDLDTGDINYIAVLAEIMRPFQADILIMHSKGPREDMRQHDQKIDCFLSHLTNRIDYPNIYFREVISKSVDDGIDYLLTGAQLDMLVMVHKHHNFFHGLFSGSLTKRMADHIQIPFLVFPPSHEKLI